jgi:hypothetical protein
MSEALGIKESMELLEGLKVLGVGAKAIMKDGKLGADDIPAALELLNKFSVLVEAGKGAGEIMPELKDVSPDELKELGTKVLEILAAVKAA